jgi:hypothetical protein
MSLRRHRYLVEAAKAKRGKFELTIGNPRSKSATKKEVSGYVLGHVGIHKSDYDWTVTHIPTGLAGASGLPTLKIAKLFAAYLAQITPAKGDNIEKLQASLQKHGRNAMDYRRYLQNGGSESFNGWTDGMNRVAKAAAPAKRVSMKLGRNEDVRLRRRGYLGESRDRQRARSIVKLAAKETSIKMVKGWLTQDEKGTWEKLAMDLLDRTKDRAEKLNMGDREVNDQIATMVALQAVEAVKRSAKRKR